MKQRRWLVPVWVVTVLRLAPAYAGLGPQNVAVVVNADSFASLTVANEYVACRNIPPGNVIALHLGDLPDFERVNVRQFCDRILSRTLEEIRRRGLGAQIDCIAYSSDIPYAIDVSPDIGQQKLPQIITPAASLNGLTFLHRAVMDQDIKYLTLNVNRYAPRVLDLPEEQYTQAEQAQLMAGHRAVRQKKWAEAMAALAELAKAHPKSADIQYDLACCLAMDGKSEEALAAVSRCVDLGWWDAGRMKDDDDFKAIRDRREFKDALARIKPPVIKVPPAPGFRASCGWDGKGHRLGGEQGGYLLSTVLAITSGRGNSLAEALASLRRSAAADATAPKGTIYYMVNPDVRSTTRQWGFAAAVAELAKAGVKGEVVQGVLPKDRPDVAGAMVGIADVNWPACGSTILPGAICEHLTSLGGVMVNNGGQTPISEFIRRGAAGSSGTVTEPYAIQAKFPNPFLHVYYAQGCTLAEAFYLSVAGPYQLLIIGDPLCRPWAKVPTVSVSLAKPKDDLRGTVTLKPAIQPADRAVTGYELFVDGRLCATCAPDDQLKFDTAKLAEGHHDLCVVAICADGPETQAQAMLPVTVRRTDFRVALADIAPVPFGGLAKLQATAPGAKRVEFTCNGQVFAAGGSADVSIDTRQLGMGTVRIQAIATFDRDNAECQVISSPCELRIDPPALLPAVADKPAAKGLVLTRAGHAPMTLDSGLVREALAKAGLKDGEPFILEGCLTAPADDLYQVQVRLDGAVAVELDGKSLANGKQPLWTFVPARLAQGLHRLRLGLAPKGPPRLELRFGVAGAQDLRCEQFSH